MYPVSLPEEGLLASCTAAFNPSLSAALLNSWRVGERVAEWLGTRRPELLVREESK
jgi:hypothetical protein